MIKINSVNKIINNNHILKDINLSFAGKGLVCILGPSGSGKTTLLNIIGKISNPTTGTVEYKNTNINKIKEQEYYSNIVSFIFQEYNLLKNLSIKDNILFPSNKEKNLNKIIKKLNLQITNKKINNLSGGEQQRIAIARSIMSNSKILLADEPTGALDSKNSYKIMKILKNISKEKLVLVVTHNIKLANKFSDRIIKINDGKIIYDSAPYTSINEYPEEKLKTKKVKSKKILKISLSNLLSKKKRNILVSLAFSIGLFSLTLVLSINNGFKKEMTNYKKILYDYPLIISKETYSLSKDILTSEKYSKEGVNINKNTGLITNNIDNKLLYKINNLDKKLYKDITYYKTDDLYFKSISHIIPKNINFHILKGKMPKNKDEVLLLLDYNQAINENIYNFLNKKSTKFEDYLNLKFKIDNKTLTITGIVTSENEYFSTLNGILYNEELFEGEITDIYIYPKDYESKIKIKEQLTTINIIDDAESTINLTKDMIDIISYVLIIFCLISLLVSCIMIYIITYISIIERKQEIGILRTLGLRKKEIRKIFTYESLIIGIISSFIALITSYGISKILNNIIYSNIGMKEIVLINMNIILTIIIISIILSYISSIIPSRKASKKTIYETLRSIN